MNHPIIILLIVCADVFFVIAFIICLGLLKAAALDPLRPDFKSNEEQRGKQVERLRNHRESQKVNKVTYLSRTGHGFIESK